MDTVSMQPSLGIDPGLEGFVVLLRPGWSGPESLMFWPTPTLDTEVRRAVRRPKTKVSMGPVVAGMVPVSSPPPVDPNAPKTKKGIKRVYDVSGMVRILKAAMAMCYEVGVVLEKQQTMRDEGVVSAFTNGQGFGLWEGLLAGLGLRYVIVHPKTWRKEMIRDVPGGCDTKTGSILVAQRMYPGVDFRRTDRCKGPDNNKTDATLIAAYGRCINV